MTEAQSTFNPDALILFAHGARKPEWRQPLDALARRMRDALPRARIETAFLELMLPNLTQAIDLVCQAGATRVVIAPVFWAAGSHLKEDVPKLLEQAAASHPQVQFEVWPALGESGPVLDAITSAYTLLWNEASAH